jgi:hypothetical protein
MDFGGVSNAARARVVGLGYDEVPKTIMKQPATPRATLTTSAIMKRTGLGRNALRLYEEKDSSGRRSAPRRAIGSTHRLCCSICSSSSKGKAAGLALGEIEELLKLLTLGRDAASACGCCSDRSQDGRINALIALLHRARRSCRNSLGTCKSNAADARQNKKADVFREGGQDVDDGLPHALRADCDPKVKPLCGEIIHSQRRKIDETKTILQRL